MPKDPIIIEKGPGKTMTIDRVMKNNIVLHSSISYTGAPVSGAGLTSQLYITTDPNDATKAKQILYIPDDTFIETNPCTWYFCGGRWWYICS